MLRECSCSEEFCLKMSIMLFKKAKPPTEEASLRRERMFGLGYWVVIVSSSSVFDVMVALTRSSLPWVPHTWVSGTNPLQTPTAWFWGTHKWAIFAALLANGVSRTVGNVLVFGPPLHRGIVRRSLRQSSWDGYSVCSGLFWGERWWSVGVMAADGVHPGFGCILQSCSGRWLSSYYDKSFDFSVWQMWWGLLLFPSFFCKLICHFISPTAGVYWYPLKNYTVSLSEGADVLCEDCSSNSCNDRIEAQLEIFTIPHCTVICLQHICSGGQGVVVCRSRATHWALIMCNVLHATWYEGADQLLGFTEFLLLILLLLLHLTEFKMHLLLALFYWLNPTNDSGSITWCLHGVSCREYVWSPSSFSAFPSYISGVHHFRRDFLCIWLLFIQPLR